MAPPAHPIAQRQTALRKTRGADGRPILNGIDYLEVAADQRTLSVYFVHPLPGTAQAVPRDAPPLTAANILITGGTRIQSIQAEFATAIDNLLVVRVNTPGDLSAYRLHIVQVSGNLTPPAGFDPQLASVEFMFRVEEATDLDCQTERPAPEKPPALPPIDYLAKDYASFRKLMLDRLTLTLPQWKERSPADIGMMLVELLAYSADQLSYYQDAVATEAYLGTARRRVSVRRHARLLDYFVHNGRNARTWVTIQVDLKADGTTLLGPSLSEGRSGVRLLTQGVSSTDRLNQADLSTETDAAWSSGVQFFETMHDVILYAAQNQIEIHPWGADQYSLPQGATQATLKDTGGQLRQQLQPGMVLILEQIRGQHTAKIEDADPTVRHAVRLIRVTPSSDGLSQAGERGQPDQVTQPQLLLTVEWAIEDALPFEFWVTTVLEGKPTLPLGVMRGNVVLVDHGQTLLQPEALPPVPETSEPYRPRLQYGPLTYRGIIHSAKADFGAESQWVSAAEVLQHSHLRDLQPGIWLQERANPANRWQPCIDLLISDRFARDFVVEMESDGRAYLRFGDNQLGRQPAPGTQFDAIYRVGNGTIGNVGAEAITRIVLDPPIPGILSVRNPLPAVGGVDPEPLDQVRFQAPQAFRERQCAVTEADYAQFAQGFPGVQRAVATRRWTGSWDTIFITVDRTGGQLVDTEFRRDLLAYLERFRLVAHTLEIDNPRFVPLDLALTVQVKPDYFRRYVLSLLQATFSDRVQTSGQLGFFHPDLHTFAQPIYLSEIVSTAMQVAGVLSVQVTRFQRLWQLPQGELETGKLHFERLEIPLLRNDPTAPEDGRIAFNLQGGLAYE